MGIVALGVTFLCVTYTTGTTLKSNYFSRTKKIDNVVISHSFMQEVEVKGEIRCSSRCSIHPTCNMVLYKSNTHQCRLFYYNPDKNETLDESGWQCLRNSKRCGAPPDLVNAEVMYVDDCVGSQASYTCKSDFRECGDMKITCQSTQRWETPPGRCERYRWIDQEKTFSEPIPCGEQSRLKLKVTGMPNRERFSYGRDIRKVELNSYINNRWGAAIRTDIFPFKSQQRLTVEMSLEDGKYHVSGNGNYISSMSEVKIGGKPDRIIIGGAVSLEEVVMVC